MKIKTLLIIGAIGNVLCWIGDVLLSVFPGATSGLTVDPVWANAPVWRFTLSAILGSIAMVCVLSGFYGIYRLIKNNNPKLSLVFLIGAMLGCIPGAVFHCLCTTVAWFYAKMGGSSQAETIVMEFFIQHSLIMILCSIGLVVSSILLFILILKEKTSLPRWAAIFNIITMLIVGGVFKPFITIPGTMNLGGLFMFVGLYFSLSKNHNFN